MSTCDAVLVLGGGVRPNGMLPPWVERRFDRAIEIRSGSPIVCLSAGTVHRPPPVNVEGYPWLESVAGAAYLLGRGVPSNRIQVEAASYDTIGNAYFAKLLHVDPAGWRRLVVITSEFHMARSRAIFEWVFGMDTRQYELRFEATSDDDVEGQSIENRRAKEAAGLAALRPLMARIRGFAELHRWLHTEHFAYTPEGWISRKASPSESVGTY